MFDDTGMQNTTGSFTAWTAAAAAAMRLRSIRTTRTWAGIGRRAAKAVRIAHALHLRRRRHASQRLSRARATALGCSGAGSGEDQMQRRWDRNIVPKFAAAVAALPQCHGGALRVTRHTIPPPDLTDLRIHPTQSTLTWEHAALPLLHKSAVAPDPPPSLAPRYAKQGRLRARGNAVPEWQQALAGCVTLPHIDRDSRGNPINTYLAVTQGVELIIAWRQSELDEGPVIADLQSSHPSFARILGLRSLTIVRAGPGDLVYMPARTVHMVITESDKVHLGFHTYP